MTTVGVRTEIAAAHVGAVSLPRQAHNPPPPRLREPMPADRLVGWLAPLLVAAVAGVLRFWRLGEPRAFVFDETYYAKDAYSLLRFGTEQAFATDANDRILAGDLEVFTGEPAFIAHPPAGKWVIALGETVFGVTPFGWRVAVAVLGTLSVLMLARIARRLFRSTLLGCTAGLLLALDGLHFVHSRTALLDLVLMVSALAAFGCLLLDREAIRSRLEAGRSPGLRPWRLLAGLFLGLAAGTKWSGIFFVAAFGLLTVAWDYGARKALGDRRPGRRALLRDAPVAFLAVVGGAVAAYLTSWTGWFRSDDGWGRQWAEENPGPPVPAALRSLWHYHAEMWRFNTGLDDFHPYASNPWSWPLLGRPVSFFYEGPKLGEAGCAVETCSRAVTALGTPALWWGGLVAVAVTAFCWLARRDWRAGAVIAGVAAGYLPWLAFQGRTVYSFYAVAFLPWVVLALTYCLGLVLGPAAASPRRRTWGAGLAGAYVLLVAMNFFWLYPVLTAQVVPYTAWAARMWFGSWI